MTKVLAFVPLETLGIHVYPDMASLTQASTAIEDGKLKDLALGARLRSLSKDFVTLVHKVNA